jgi:hypothetical protein
MQDIAKPLEQYLKAAEIAYTVSGSTASVHSCQAYELRQAYVFREHLSPYW